VTHAPFTGGVVAAMLTLGMLGSGIAYILNFTVIKNSDATTASTTTYVITLVSVVVGALVLGETITWNEPVGGVLVVFGAATAQGLISRVRSRRATD
jgi:drug/metabolite transporter (DMT)-like permease